MRTLIKAELLFGAIPTHPPVPGIVCDTPLTSVAG